MQFYGIEWERCLKLPTRVFWAMYRQIGFIQAEENLRMLHLLRMSQAGAPADDVKDFVRKQELELEKVVIPDHEHEARQGRMKLKELAARMGG